MRDVLRYSYVKGLLQGVVAKDDLLEGILNIYVIWTLVKMKVIPKNEVRNSFNFIKNVLKMDMFGKFEDIKQNQISDIVLKLFEEDDNDDVDFLILNDVLSLVAKDFINKSDWGLFLTPRSIALMMINKVFELCKKEGKNPVELVYLDPSSGGGVFPALLLESLISINKGVFNISQFLERNLVMYELNPICATITRWTMFLTTIHYFPNLPSPRIKIINTDFLQSKSIQYDIIIGNPPYGISVKKEFNNQKILSGTNHDIFLYFLYKAVSDVKKGGIVSFILPSSFLLNVKLESIRDLLVRSYKIHYIVDFIQSKFTNVDTENCIVIFEKDQGSAMDNHLVECISYLENPKQIIYRKQSDFLDLPFVMLNPHLNDKDLEIIQVLITGTRHLDIDFDIKRGIEFGKSNEMFSEIPRRNAYPIIAADNIFLYQLLYFGLNINKNTEKNLKDIKNYERPKLMIHGVKKLRYRTRLTAALDTEKYLSLSSCYMIFSRMDNLEDLTFLEGFLNSYNTNFLYSKLFPTTRIKQAFLNIIPIPKIPEGSKKEIISLINEYKKGIMTYHNTHPFDIIKIKMEDPDSINQLIDDYYQIFRKYKDLVISVSNIFFKHFKMTSDQIDYIVAFISNGKKPDEYDLVVKYVKRQLLLQLRSIISRYYHNNKSLKIEELKDFFEDHLRDTEDSCIKKNQLSSLLKICECKIEPLEFIKDIVISEKSNIEKRLVSLDNFK